MKQIKLFRLGQKKGKINFRFVCDDGSESKKKIVRWKWLAAF